jgi:hypothetical protein
MADHIVTKYGRERAVRGAADITNHQLDRIWDAVRSAQELLGEKKSDLVLVEINKICSLAGSAKSACHQLISLERDNQRAAEVEKFAKAENDAAVRAITEAPFADQVQPAENVPFVPGLKTEPEVVPVTAADDIPF